MTLHESMSARSLYSLYAANVTLIIVKFAPKLHAARTEDRAYHFAGWQASAFSLREDRMTSQPTRNQASDLDDDYITTGHIIDERYIGY